MLLLREDELRLGLLPDEAEARLPDDLLLEDEAFGPLLALARSLCALLLRGLDLDEEDFEAEGLDEEEEDFEAEGFDEDEEEELRDAMACSLGW